MQVRHRWELALIGVCGVWGSTFTLVRDALVQMPPFLFIALRFAIAAGTLSLFGPLRDLHRDEARAGIIIGIPLFAGYAFQTSGQQYTSPSNAGFITGLMVVFVPLIAVALFRKLPSKGALLGVVLATTGLVLLAMPAGFRIGKGDALVLGGAVSFAFHIIAIGRLSPGRSALRLTAVQTATAAVLAGAWSIIAERQTPPGAEPQLWFAVALTGVVATAAGFVIQTRAQQAAPPTRTAVILTAEPVFAGIFGYALAGDRLGARGYAGAGLIVLGILAAELLAPAREEV